MARPAAVFAGIALFFLGARVFACGSFVVVSGSMESTLLPGDVVLADRAAVGARVPGTKLRLPGYSNPRRGEVWVFRPPGNVGISVTKRIVGVPGDVLVMRDGGLWVNGVERDEPYVNARRGMDERSDDFRWQTAYLAPEIEPETYDRSGF